MALTDKLAAIADAIRERTGGTEPLTLDQMAAEIAEIETDPVLAELTITENGEYTPGEGVDGFGRVTVEVAIAGGTAEVRVWEGEVEFNNADSISMAIPVDDTTFDRYIVDAWVVETGTVADGVVTLDEKPTIPGSSNRWATAFAISRLYYGGEIVESIDVIMGSSGTTYTAAHAGGMSMRGSPSSEHTQITGLDITDDGLALKPSTSRYFCKSGYYAKFRYSVVGLREVTA